MCSTLLDAKTVSIGYTTLMVVKEIHVPSRGMRQTGVHMGREAMGKWIDADALIDKLMNAIECGRRVDMPTQELEAVLSDVRNAPSIDIVFCKECKKHNTHRCHMAFDLVANNDDDFCSYGEREGE